MSSGPTNIPDDCLVFLEFGAEIPPHVWRRLTAPLRAQAIIEPRPAPGDPHRPGYVAVHVLVPKAIVEGRK